MTDHRRRHLLPLLCCVALLCGLSQPLWAESTSSLESLAKNLAALRVRVEELSGLIDQQKAQTQGALRSLSLQQAELEAQVQRESFRVKQLRSKKAALLQEVAASKGAKDTLAPAVGQALGKVRAHVALSLPFKRQERLEQVDAITRHLQGGLISPEKAAARLWQLMEDERRLAGESGLYQQVVEVEGEAVLCEVVRLGMIALYFQTPQGRFGVIRRAHGAWKVRLFLEEEAQQQTTQLFDHFKKNLRTGFFVLPSPIEPG